MKIRVTYDFLADAAYIYLKDIAAGGVSYTVHFSEYLNLDFDKNGGRLIGIEVLNASQVLPLEFLSRAEII